MIVILELIFGEISIQNKNKSQTKVKNNKTMAKEKCNNKY